MSFLCKDSHLEGLHGSVLLCTDCQRPTVHFTAEGGLPICGYCGATPVQAEYLLEPQPGAWLRSLKASVPALLTRR